MENEVAEVIGQYDLTVNKTTLIRHNENKVYKLITNKEKYVLRIHENQQNINLNALVGTMDKYRLITDEMEILEFLFVNYSDKMQKPIRNNDGNWVTRLADGRLATIITWVNGEGLDKVACDESIFCLLGRSLNDMHAALAKLKLNYRIDYGENLIGRLDNELKTAFEQKHISRHQYHSLAAVLVKIINALQNCTNQQIVHADLGKSNFILTTDKTALIPIDFSMSGLCIPEYDLASIALHYEKSGEKDIIISEYKKYSKNAVNDELIQLCICYQIVMFIACQHNNVWKQPWFSDAVDYWCNGIIKNSLEQTLYSEEIGLYQS